MLAAGILFVKNVQKLSIKHETRLRNLVDLLLRYNYEYYVLDAPSVSDDEWDALYRELVALEKETGIVLPNSPTREIGGGKNSIKKGFKKHKHVFPLMSLDKAQSINEVKKWYQGIISKFPDTEFTASFKYDGLALVLTYENGNLIVAATRGDGKVGEDVTQQVKMISRGIPRGITLKEKIEICGEGVMRRSVLKKFPEYKNARNAAAGAIRNIDPQITSQRDLDFLAYDLKFERGRQDSLRDKYCILDKLGFMTERLDIFKSAEELESVIVSMTKQRMELDFDTDGIVFTANDVAVRDELGSTIKFPRWAMAYKFEAEVVETKLLNVVWQVGRSGKVTPVAILEPVELCGATVSRATLNNYGDILRKGVSIGADVVIRRSNDVIPEVLGAVSDCQSNVVDINKCPSCGVNLETIGANKFCKNQNCSARVLEKFTHFVARDCMNIEGLSEKTLEALIEKSYIKKLGDIYRLTIDQLAALEGFKDKKISNLLESIQKSKMADFASVINALGIPNIGKKASGTLASAFASFQDLRQKTASDLLNLDDFGDVMAESVSIFFVENAAEIDDLLVQLDIQHKAVANGFLRGLKICVTGTLVGYTRSQIAKTLESFGATVVDSVSKTTSILIVGENAGGKLEKAQKLGLKIIDENRLSDFLANDKI